MLISHMPISHLAESHVTVQSLILILESPKQGQRTHACTLGVVPNIDDMLGIVL